MEIRMELMEIMPKVFYISFPNKKELTTTMCRPQEYYESEHSHIRGQYFDWPTFIDTFSEDTGELKYFGYWSGFNIPSDVFQQWMKDFAHDFSSKEKALIELISKYVDIKNEKYYIIASEKGKVSTIQHEIAHALYHLNENYKSHMDTLSSTLPVDFKDTFKKTLNKMGYADSVILDETQAYLSTSDAEYFQNRLSMDVSHLKTQMAEMKKYIDSYASENSILNRINS